MKLRKLALGTFGLHKHFGWTLLLKNTTNSGPRRAMKKQEWNWRPTCWPTCWHNQVRKPSKWRHRPLNYRGRQVFKYRRCARFMSSSKDSLSLPDGPRTRRSPSKLIKDLENLGNVALLPSLWCVQLKFDKYETTKIWSFLRNSLHDLHLKHWQCMKQSFASHTMVLDGWVVAKSCRKHIK